MVGQGFFWGLGYGTKVPELWINFGSWEVDSFKNEGCFDQVRTPRNMERRMVLLSTMRGYDSGEKMVGDP
jgi:hypothetical protein